MRESRELDAVIATVDDAEIATESLDFEYRTNMMRGSLEAGFAFSNASVGAVHARSNNALF